MGVEDNNEDDIPFEEKMKTITSELSKQFEESHRLEEEIRNNLKVIEKNIEYKKSIYDYLNQPKIIDEIKMYIQHNNDFDRKYLNIKDLIIKILKTYKSTDISGEERLIVDINAKAQIENLEDNNDFYTNTIFNIVLNERENSFEYVMINYPEQ